jgi:twitching motility protein PilT
LVTIEGLLQELVERGGSDLHISAGAPPMFRVNGELLPSKHPVMDPDSTQKLVYSVLDNNQIAKFERDQELDMSFGLQGLGRFRTNAFMQRGAVGGVLRMIPYEVKSFRDLNLDETVCKQICSYRKGLVLVTGTTGSGKSTTLAAILDYINNRRKEHIMTIEDPIEFVHRNKMCLINQREIGSDTKGFKNALRTVLRQDPDVVLVGEMRDPETIEAALTISETGHLTFATLHTSDAIQTINRIIDVFPAYQQQQVRTQLSFTLNAVFSQQLIPKPDGKSRVLACEILLANSAVRSLIRDDKAHQIYSVMQTHSRIGMKTMNMSLADLIDKGVIDRETAMARSNDADDLRRVLEGRNR